MNRSAAPFVAASISGGAEDAVDCGLTPLGVGISLSVGSGQGGRDQTDSQELIEPMSPSRRATALLLATGLGLGLAGCGSADPATKGPVSESPSSSTPSPTEASSTPTPTQRPLSRYEDKAPVKVMRSWAVAYGKAINADDRSLGALAPYSTRAGLKLFPRLGAEDFGTYFPGPQPFTPLRVKVSGGTAVVSSCLWSDGWGQDRRTKLPARKRNIVPADLVFKKQAGRWKLDTVNAGRNSCSQVPVKGIPW
jgi:hypothetical protein